MRTRPLGPTTNSSPNRTCRGLWVFITRALRSQNVSFIFQFPGGRRGHRRPSGELRSRTFGGGNELSRDIKLAYLLRDTVAIKKKIAAGHHEHDSHDAHAVHAEAHEDHAAPAVVKDDEGTEAEVSGATNAATVRLLPLP